MTEKPAPKRATYPDPLAPLPTNPVSNADQPEKPALILVSRRGFYQIARLFVVKDETALIAYANTSRTALISTKVFLTGVQAYPGTVPYSDHDKARASRLFNHLNSVAETTESNIVSPQQNTELFVGDFDENITPYFDDDTGVEAGV